MEWIPRSKLVCSEMLNHLVGRGFQIEFHRHATAILAVDFPDVFGELRSDPQRAVDPNRRDRRLWWRRDQRHSAAATRAGPTRLRKDNFTIEKRINGVQNKSISHEVDHVRTFPDSRVVALEIEWNNKGSFFDRELENFKRLHAGGAISVGVIITRGETLQTEDDISSTIRLRSSRNHGSSRWMYFRSLLRDARYSLTSKMLSTRQSNARPKLQSGVSRAL